MELARIVDQVALWLLVDIAPWFARAASVLWQNHTALLAVIGIILLYIRTRASDRQARTGEQGHITDRFTKAIEQLGSEKMAVRLGAIYALERLSKDSPGDHWTIMEVLTAYVREVARPHESAHLNPFVQLQVNDPDGAVDEPPEETRPIEEVRAVLTVFGRRNAQAQRYDRAARRRLDLSNTNLSGITLAEWNFQRAILSRADLRSASFWHANFQNAFLVEADFRCANLGFANLRHAALSYADLRRADLAHARLQDAVLAYAKLQHADLAYADLQRTWLEEAELQGAILRGARLQGADLRRAKLEKADMAWAKLMRAKLQDADMQRADLSGANLKRAHLQRANFEHADLRDADLRRARGLTQEQVNSADGNERTVLPEGLTRPALWLARESSSATLPPSPPPPPEPRTDDAAQRSR